MQGQNKIVKGPDISNIVKDFDLNTKLSTLATKAALESEQDKIVKLQTHFLSKIIFGNDGSQNMFLYQPTLNKIEPVKDKATNYVLSWKSKWVYASKLKPLYTVFFA